MEINSRPDWSGVSMVTDKPVFNIDKRRCKKSRAHHGPYLVNEYLATVECQTCGEKINPITVLMELAKNESTWNARMDRVRAEILELEERSKFKCAHCGRVNHAMVNGPNARI